MPQTQDRALTDPELLAVFNDERGDLSLLSREERARLVKLTEPNREPDFKMTIRAERPLIDRALDALPMAGGIAGGILGGVGGTAFGLGFGGMPGAIGGASFGGATGEAAKGLGKRILGREDIPATAGAATKDLAKAGAIQGTAEAVGGAVTKGVSAGARAVYRGYLKPALSERLLPKARQIVDTALNEALPISRAGAEKAGRVIGELRAEVDRILASMPGRVDLKQIADRVRGFARRRYFQPGADLADYQQALAVADKIDMHPSLGLPAGARPTRVEVPLPAANETKRALDTSIKETGFGVPAGAKKTTEKYARSEIRRELEGQAPQVAALNARESKLIDAAKAIARAVEREANQNPVYGMKTLASVAVGGADYARGDDALSALAKGAGTRALLRPGTQSLVAIVANRIAKQLGVATATALRLAHYALSEPEGQPDQVPNEVHK